MSNKNHDAVHEAGHAVVMYDLGHNPLGISIQDDFLKKIGGETCFQGLSDEDFCIVCSGGVAATYIKRNGKIDVDSLSDDDVSNIWSEFGGTGSKEADFWQVFALCTNVENPMREALKILLHKQNWQKVLALSVALMEQKALNGQDIDSILRD